MAKKIAYIEGLRGCAALSVVFAHYFVGFYPSMYTGNAAETNTHSQIELFFAKSPLNFLYNGHFAVCIFFVLSAYVLSYRFFRTKELSIVSRSAIRRYIRLEIPIIVSVLFSWLMLKTGLYHNLSVAPMTHSQWWLGTWFHFAPDFYQALKESIWDCFFAFNHTTSYNSVLWTMGIELQGSFLVFSFLAVFGKTRNRLIPYLAMILIFAKGYYLCFVFGLILSDLHNSDYRVRGIIRHSVNRFTIALLLVFCALFGSFFPDNRSALFEFMNNKWLTSLGLDLFIFYHTLGAVIVCFVVLNFIPLQKILSIGICSFLGRISFSLYLIHFPIICSLQCILFTRIAGMGFRYGVVVLLSGFISLCVIMIASYIMTKYVDEKAIHLSRRIEGFYSAHSFFDMIVKKLQRSSVPAKDEKKNL